MSKLAFVAAAATLLAFAPSFEAKAQKGIGIKVRDGITVKDPAKAKLEANTYLNEADKLREGGQMDLAVKKYQKALRAYPNEAGIYKNLGGTYAKMGKWPEAEATLKQGSQMFPKDWLIWNNYAVVLLQLGKLEECKVALKTCLALNPPAAKAEEMQVTLKAITSTKPKTKTQ
ncbi:MAG: tetratricopeptide repeat protein [Candidatus Melainabacteria bacterium]|nr:tetratricopeptide repeat protein [Candidatus Melainabacteria bacterium]